MRRAISNSTTSPLFVGLVASGSVHLGLLALLAAGFSLKNPAVSVTEIAFIERAAPKSTAPVTAAVPVKTAPVAKPVEVSPELPVSETPETVSDVAAMESSAGIRSYEAEVAGILNARKHYPEAARRLRQQGRVKMAFEIDRNGRVLSVAMIEGSPYSILNEAAQKLVQEIKNFKAFPDGIQAQVWKFTVPIEYKM